MRLSGSVLALGLLILVSACMQDPAGVEYRGDEYYGREHEAALDSPNHQTYPENSSRMKQEYVRPVEPAAVQPVTVADLPPTQAQQSAAAAAAEKPSPSRSADSSRSQFIWPVEGGKVILRFGPKPGGVSNDGINIAITEGEPIRAAAAGTVVYAASDLQRYGNMVVIRHDGGWMTAYAHAKSLAVKKGAAVRQGDIIGYVGQTGGVQAPQLHFAIRDGRTPVDPELYLPRNTAGM